MTRAAPSALPSPEFWRGRRVLLTGHTGFKGSWLTTWLLDLGAEVCGVSLSEAPSEPCLWDQLDLSIAADVRSDVAGEQWQNAAADFSPQTVLHLAAQSLVPEGYRDPARTFATNVQGTVRVLELAERLPDLSECVIITTDKVYDTHQPTPFVEGSFLGGADPYSASKASAELVVQSWPRTNDALATARSGNVIGGGDWSSDRLLPDLIRSWAAGDPAVLRRPGAIRPWQHVLEPLRGYLLFVQHLASGATETRALNFGPPQESVTVAEVADCAAETWAEVTSSERPPWSALPAPPMHETLTLELDSSLAEKLLGWRSELSWQEAVSLSVRWYARVSGGAHPLDEVRSELAAYSTRVGEA